MINLSSAAIYERTVGGEELMSLEEAKKKRQTFREDVFNEASDKFKQATVEHDKISMLMDMKYQEELKSWSH